MICRVLGAILLLGALPAAAESAATAAVASNFRATATALVAHFEAIHAHRIRISVASTGKHYAQIVNGAPFDLFLAADAERPRLLEESGIAVFGSRFTYANGRLVLWSSDKNTCNLNCRGLVESDFDGRLAIANPDLAPYGVAARDVLQVLGRWDALNAQRKLVIGENIAQAFQFVATGNARFGFVATSQLVAMDDPRSAGCLWPVPAALHPPIAQQAVLLDRARDNPAALAFLEFLKSEAASAIITAYGYEPGGKSP